MRSDHGGKKTVDKGEGPIGLHIERIEREREREERERVRERERESETRGIRMFYGLSRGSRRCRLACVRTHFDMATGSILKTCMNERVFGEAYVTKDAQPENISCDYCCGFHCPKELARFVSIIAVRPVTFEVDSEIVSLRSARRI